MNKTLPPVIIAKCEQGNSQSALEDQAVLARALKHYDIAGQSVMRTLFKDYVVYTLVKKSEGQS